MTSALAFDPGYGNIKLYGPQGGLVLPSLVSVAGESAVRHMAGLRAVRPPLRVQVGPCAFHVGEGAHEWGRPVENLDLTRLTGSPEMLALFLGAIARYGVPSDPVALMVGLPIAALLGEEGKGTQEAVRSALARIHTWKTDGADYTMEVESVRLTSQPVGAMFDYLLSDSGEMSAERQAAFRSELGILSIGMNTVELLVVANGAPVQRFTTGGALGVRRLLELTNQDGLYSLGELDAKLRAGVLDIRAALPVWQSEVTGFVERHWGVSHRRFQAVVVVGGGARLLRDGLLTRFRDKAFIPDDPVISTARGLYKYALMKAKRR